VTNVATPATATVASKAKEIDAREKEIMASSPNGSTIRIFLVQW
jgi:hypothetical protein